MNRPAPRLPILALTHEKQMEPVSLTLKPKIRANSASLAYAVGTNLTSLASAIRYYLLLELTKIGPIVPHKLGHSQAYY